MGDSYEKDVIGAKNAGMRALFLLREEHGEHPIQRRKREQSEDREGEGGQGDQEEICDEEALAQLKLSFPEADMISFTLRPQSLMNTLQSWANSQYGSIPKI